MAESKQEAERSPARGNAKKSSASTTKTAGKRHTQGADAHKTPGKKAEAKNGQRPSSAQACWPGYEPTPGKAAGEKGSCQPKKHQTKAEKKGDQKAAAASRLSGQR